MSEQQLNHAERAHARFSASGSERWLSCPASIKAEIPYPNTSSVFAEEGTLAHELADTALQAGKRAAEYVGELILGKVITAEMAAYVDKYIEYIENVKAQYDDAIVMFERRVDYSNLAPEGFGTLDCAVISPSARVAHVFDLKYGKGVEVSAEKNTQAMMYSSGLLNEMDILDIFDTFHIHICQPRIHNFSEWVISVNDLLAWQPNVTTAVELALSDDPPYGPSEKACKWCKHKANCRALLDQYNAEVGKFFDCLGDKDAVAGITDAEKRQLLDHKDLVIAFLTAIEGDIENRLMNGETFEGYKLVAGRNTTVWHEGAEDELDMLYGEKMYTRKFIGITAARKILSTEEIAKYTHKATGAPKMVKESDKGEPIVLSGFDNLDA